MQRCRWAETSENMQKYHDQVWGVPLMDDQKLFRKLVMDINQAGLSWQTILNKEAAFDQAFDFFAIEKVAVYDEQKITELLKNEGIIRNRRKIEAAIHNAKMVLKIQEEFTSFSSYLWHFTNQQVQINKQRLEEPLPATSELSDKISLDMKKRGFKFIGSTIIYAYLQAVGVVNDHAVECFRYKELTEAKN